MRYLSANEYFKEKFGEKVYKLALDGGMTCPNRDGRCGTRGCIFCSEGGSGEFAEPYDGDVARQILRAVRRVENKSNAKKFIAYFQNNTNTYADVGRLSELFGAAVRQPSIVALSIGTRPDCLPNDVVALLKRLNNEKPLFVELGLQTMHEKTARYIRRGYPLEVYDDAVSKLRQAGINVITHVIIGLPGESRSEILQTIDHVGEAGSDGVKLQLLHVLKGTDLAEDYERGCFRTLGLEEYANILCDAIERLPKSVVIHRLTGDAPKRLLIAPLWSADKKKVLNYINARLETRGVIQGNKCKIGPVPT